MRFELTQPNGHYPLKVACLPIPPPGHKPFFLDKKNRAKNGTRTRDPNLGKVVLYQLSYFRNCDAKVSIIFELPKIPTTFFLKKILPIIPFSFLALTFLHLLCV